MKWFEVKVSLCNAFPSKVLLISLNICSFSLPNCHLLGSLSFPTLLYFHILVWNFGYWNKFYSVDWFLVGWEKRKTESPWFSSFVFFILYVWSWYNKKWSLNLHIFFYDMQVCDVAWIMLIVVLCFREPFCHYSTQLVRV